MLTTAPIPAFRSLGSADDAVKAYRLLRRTLAGQEPDLLQLARAAAEVIAPELRFHQQNFTLASPDGTTPCPTLHTVVRAARSDGSEGLVLWVQGSQEERGPANSAAAALAAAVGVAAAVHLQRARWLAKDTVVVFAAGPCEPLALGAAWTGLYNSGQQLFDFPRAGLLQQALVLEVASPAVQAAELRLHGWQGLLPNLDFYYLIKRNLDIHTSLPVVVQPRWRPGPRASELTAAIGRALPHGLAGSAAAQAYAAELAAAASFALQLGSGEPNGVHGAFLELGVDSATLRLVGSSSTSEGARRGKSSDLAVAGSAAHALAAVEMVLRTCNNLQERLHHSTALYLLLSPDRFISIADYIAPPALLLAAALGQVGGVQQHRDCCSLLPIFCCHRGCLFVGTPKSDMEPYTDSLFLVAAGASGGKARPVCAHRSMEGCVVPGSSYPCSGCHSCPCLAPAGAASGSGRDGCPTAAGAAGSPDRRKRYRRGLVGRQDERGGGSSMAGSRRASGQPGWRLSQQQQQQKRRGKTQAASARGSGCGGDAGRHLAPAGALGALLAVTGVHLGHSRADSGPATCKSGITAAPQQRSGKQGRTAVGQQPPGGCAFENFLGVGAGVSGICRAGRPVCGNPCLLCARAVTLMRAVNVFIALAKYLVEVSHKRASQPATVNAGQGIQHDNEPAS